MLKSNIIKRTTPSKESIIEWSVTGKNIEINITGDEIHYMSLLKLILRETKLYNFKYHRVSPFKLRKRHHIRTRNYDFQLQFIDIKDNYKLKKQILLTTTNSSSSVLGNITMFIPDFLELCTLEGYLERGEDGYNLIEDIECTGSICTYIQQRQNAKPNSSKVIDRGFTVPKSYYN